MFQNDVQQQIQQSPAYIRRKVFIPFCNCVTGLWLYAPCVTGLWLYAPCVTGLWLYAPSNEFNLFFNLFSESNQTLFLSWIYFIFLNSVVCSLSFVHDPCSIQILLRRSFLSQPQAASLPQSRLDALHSRRSHYTNPAPHKVIFHCVICFQRSNLPREVLPSHPPFIQFKRLSHLHFR